MRKLKTSSADLVAKARSAITEIGAGEAVGLVGSDAHQFVDIRDIRERSKTGWVPGSFHCPRGMLEFWVDPESPYVKDVFSADKTFVLYCASGWRSALATARLQDMGFGPVAHVAGGFTSWLETGGAVEHESD